VARGEWGQLVRLQNNAITTVPLADAAGEPRLVSGDHPLLAEARAIGIELGG
jgi:6-phosphofructokinase 1